jgi:hypothetical protein
MKGPQVNQVFFSGSHGTLGWVENEAGLAHGPLAWMVQQLSTFLGITFDEAKLKKCFPHYYVGDSIVPASHAWYEGRIERSNLLTLTLIGQKPRQPGRTYDLDRTAHPQVHIGARFRNNIDKSAVPGYILKTPQNGRAVWALQKRSWRWIFRTDTDESKLLTLTGPGTRSWFESRTGARIVDHIQEAPVGPLEARLLGLPLSFVTHETELGDTFTAPLLRQ